MGFEIEYTPFIAKLLREYYAIVGDLQSCILIFTPNLRSLNFLIQLGYQTFTVYIVVNTV